MQMNEAQQRAVLHKDGPMLVLAGPGSGKTLVITERTRHLTEDMHIPEEQILVITFTKAAAKEMKDRFLAQRKSGRTGVNFGTFHAVFFTILKYAYHLNSGNIVKEEVRFQYLKEIVHKLELEYEDEKEFIGDISSEISLVKGTRMELANYYSVHCAHELFRTLYSEYNHRLRRANLIDFDDMLLMCHQLLSEREDILSVWQNKFRYILIDEFQDINLVQYEIIRMLSLPKNNLFVVGDDDQSIYRFRGAKPEIMLQFPSDYPDSGRVYLDKNYRSLPEIVAASTRVIGNNKNRFAKTITAVRESEGGLMIRHFETLAQENQALCEEILKRNREGLPLNDMAVLIRTSMGMGSLVHKLMEYNISFRMKDSLPNLYEHWVTADVFAYIKIAMGRTERSLYLQIINRPKRYVSRECFDQPEVDFDAVKDYYEDKNWMLARFDQFEYDLSVLARMGPYAAINYIRRGIGYEGFLKEYAQERRMNEEELLNILDELQENAREYKTYEEWFSYIQTYKEELRKQAADQSDQRKDCLTVATMHSAKGLEFHTVFLIDVGEGIIPHKRAVLPEDIEEERRLFYVAMTRAKDALFIYSAKERYNKVSKWSRFIDELTLEER